MRFRVASLLSWAAPMASGVAIGLCAFLPLAGPVGSAATRPGDGVLAWAMAGGLALLAAARCRLPRVGGPVPGLAWLVAAAIACAVLGRHAVDCLLVTATELPLSADAGLGLDLGDALLGGGLLLPASAWMLRGGVLRSGRPGLAWPAVVAVVLVAVPLVAGRGRTPSLPAGGDAGDAIRLLPSAAALAWVAALAGALPVAPGGGRALRRTLAPLLAAVAIGGMGVALPYLLGSARSHDGADAVLAAAGRRAFGAFGDRIGAGMECLACLLLAGIVLVLASRVAARSIPRLGGWILPLLATAAVLLQDRASFDRLLLLAAVAGWSSVALGVRPAADAP